MIELVAGLSGVIVILLFAVFFSLKEMFAAVERADIAEESLFLLKQSYEAIEFQMKKENNEHENDEKRINRRNYYGDSDN